MSGITAAGFQAKTLEEILGDLRTRQRSTVDGSLNSSATGVVANLNASIALELADLWELAQEVYDAHDPNSAQGVAADHNGALSGTPREDRRKSVVTLRLTLTANTLVQAGSVVSVLGSPTVRFATIADAQAPSTDGTLDVVAASEQYGAVNAPSGTLTHIESPVSGWTAVTNPAAATLGAEVESDEDYRLRRTQELASVGGSTLDGIKADLRKLPGVISVGGIENVGDIVDADGLPPHSFEILVLGDTAISADIAAGIFADKPAGIETWGTETVSLTDSEGIAHDVRFTRPAVATINVTCAATVDATYVAGSIESALRSGSVDPKSRAYFDVGKPVYLAQLFGAAIAVQGVLNLTMDIARAPATPADAIPDAPNRTITLSPREIAVIGAWVQT